MTSHLLTSNESLTVQVTERKAIPRPRKASLGLPVGQLSHSREWPRRNQTQEEEIEMTFLVDTQAMTFNTVSVKLFHDVWHRSKTLVSLVLVVCLVAVTPSGYAQDGSVTDL